MPSRAPATRDDLTERQSRALAVVVERLREGRAPTYAELARELGVTDMAAYKLVQQLRRRGHLQPGDGSHRGIRLAENAPSGLPLVGRVAAGSPILSTGNIESYMDVPAQLFRPRADYLYQVKGLSMKDLGILPGDLVGVHAQPVADNGQVVVARLPGRSGEDEITLKRFFRKGRRVILKPENPDFAPIEVDLSAGGTDSQERPPVAIEGLYCGLVRRGGDRR